MTTEEKTESRGFPLLSWDIFADHLHPLLNTPLIKRANEIKSKQTEGVVKKKRKKRKSKL